MRHFIELQYKGTKYRGWQRQLKVPSVQEQLEDGLSKILKRKVTCHGCGRTDAGVHASQFYAHFYLEKNIDFDLKERLNYTLPKDIRIKNIFPVGSNFNVQLSALSRTYIYKINAEENPFLTEISSCYPMAEADKNLLEKTATLISQGIDFRSFCKQPDINKHTRCRIDASFWKMDEATGHYEYHIIGDRFLRGMVRLIVGTSLEVAFGRMSLEDFEKHLFEQKELSFFPSAFPQGLYLAGVAYPDGFDELNGS